MEEPVKPILKSDSNMPEPLYDVEAIGDRSSIINRRDKVTGTRNHKTRGNYGFRGKGAENILFGKPQEFICECGWEVKSAFKNRICDKCQKEMELKDEKED